MKELEFIERIQNGNLSMGKFALINEFVKNNDGKYIAVSIKRTNPRRSNQQNKYWHGVLVPFTMECHRDTGVIMNAAEAHDWLKDNFLTRQELNNKGDYIAIKGSTRKLTTVEFNKKLEDEILPFFAEYFNTSVPLPGEQSILEFNK